MPLHYGEFLVRFEPASASIQNGLSQIIVTTCYRMVPISRIYAATTHLSSKTPDSCRLRFFCPAMPPPAPALRPTSPEACSSTAASSASEPLSTPPSSKPSSSSAVRVNLEAQQTTGTEHKTKVATWGCPVMSTVALHFAVGALLNPPSSDEDPSERQQRGDVTCIPKHVHFDTLREVAQL